MDHFIYVDQENIKTDFSKDSLHRISLVIPFQNRSNYKPLCIIGQNPSKANCFVADRTIYFLEEQIYNNYPEYSHLVILNLFTRIDTKKELTTDLLRPEFEDKYTEIIKNIDDILLIFGQRDQERAYNFKEQFNKIRKILENKKTMSLYIGKDVDYPPHPLNPQLLYKKVDFRIIDFNI